jgi:predicted PhzF superfamily epimerase YddE/YHI9
MELPIYQLDAFTSHVFRGNPASVVPLDRWLPDDVLQSIAMENNQAETAFFVARGSGTGTGDFHLRWFTPALEMDLCGHATLAAAHVIWSRAGWKSDRITFDSRSGVLNVHRRDARLVLDFPSRPGKPVEITPAVVAALGGRRPAALYQARDLMCVFDNKRDVHELVPDFAVMMKLDALGVIATAPGAGHDFVSRFFAPRAGVNEDPVTGSAHCTLVPYWASKLGKAHVTGHQVSRRGGELFCELSGDRVLIGGACVEYMHGKINV